MGTVVAIGEQVRVGGWALAGVTVLAAERPEEVRRAWTELPVQTALVIVTPVAAEALGIELLESTRPLTVVMPP